MKSLYILMFLMYQKRDLLKHLQQKKIFLVYGQVKILLKLDKKSQKLESKKKIKENVQQISSKYIKFFSEQGIPFNYEQKVKEVKNDNFNLADEGISIQANKYIACYIFETNIKNKEELIEKISYLKKNDIYVNGTFQIE